MKYFYIKTIIMVLCMIYATNCTCNDETSYSLCHGFPKKIPQFNKFEDPSSLEGKCFSILISVPTQSVQWINKNALIALPYIPEDSPLVFFDPKNTIKYREEAIVIGTKPVQYNNINGFLITAPTFKILKYVDKNDNNFIYPTKYPLIFPEIEQEEDNTENIKLLCQMYKNKKGFLETRNCIIKNYKDNLSYKEFLRSALNYVYNSSWKFNELKIDKNKYSHMNIQFSLEE